MSMYFVEEFYHFFTKSNEIIYFLLSFLKTFDLGRFSSIFIIKF